MMRENSLSKRIQALKEQHRNYEKDDYKTLAPKTETKSSPSFFKVAEQTANLTGELVSSSTTYQKI